MADHPSSAPSNKVCVSCGRPIYGKAILNHQDQWGKLADGRYVVMGGGEYWQHPDCNAIDKAARNA